MTTYKHNFEDDHTGPIWGFTCTKCKRFEFWLQNVEDDCSVADAPSLPDVLDVDYKHLTNSEIRRILGSGNVPNDIQRG